MIARRGKVAYSNTFGYRNLEARQPMTEDTIFAIASMTKPVTCVAVMILVERGMLGLDDPVAKYLPELKDLRVIGDAKDDTATEVATVPAKREGHDPRPALRIRRDSLTRNRRRSPPGCGIATLRPVYSVRS